MSAPWQQRACCTNRFAGPPAGAQCSSLRRDAAHPCLAACFFFCFFFVFNLTCMLAYIKIWYLKLPSEDLLLLHRLMKSWKPPVEVAVIVLCLCRFEKQGDPLTHFSHICMHDLPLHLRVIGSTTETALISMALQIKATLVIYYVTFYTILPEKTTDIKGPCK